MRAHQEDLRSQGADDDLVRTLAEDFRRAPLSQADRRLLEFAEKLTRAPGEMSPHDVEDLRRAGFSDEAIHDAVQVIAYFNYINRVADGLGVDPEPEWKE